MHSELGKKLSVKKVWLSWKDATECICLLTGGYRFIARWPSYPGPKPSHQLIKIFKKNEYEITTFFREYILDSTFSGLQWNPRLLASIPSLLTMEIWFDQKKKARQNVIDFKCFTFKSLLL